MSEETSQRLFRLHLEKDTRSGDVSTNREGIVVIGSTVKGRNVKLTGTLETSVLKKINTQQLLLVAKSY